MKIKQADIFQFGKLQNETITFSEGLNVIYGENEAGKSTLHDFLIAMLFGMEKGRGRAAAGDKYVRYEPWHTPSYYSGSLRFLVGERPFYLERNFYYKEKKEILKNEADQEELSIAYGDLEMLLGGIRKETFENTCDIPQSGAATGKELAEILSQYLSDVTESGDAGIHVTEAKQLLANKKRELNQELKNLRNRKNQQIHNLTVEKELLERDCRGLQNNIEDAEREITRLKQMQVEEISRKRKEQQEKKPKEPVQTKKGRISIGVLAGAIAAIILNGILYGILHYPVPVVVVTELLFSIAGAVAALIWKQEKEELLSAAQEKKLPEAFYGNAALVQAERMLKNLRDSQAEKETRRYHITEQMEEITAPGREEQGITEKIQAVELATSEISRLSGLFYDGIRGDLDAAVSEWVSTVTDGRYDHVSVDSDGKLCVHADGMDLPPEALSRGTLEQLYLGLRLAVGELVTKEEEMPLFLDEAFCMYDDERLKQTLKRLAGKKKQILLFTCQKREMECLDQMGIAYHKVVLR